MTVDLENSIFYLKEERSSRVTAEEEVLQICHFKSKVFRRRFEIGTHKKLIINIHFNDSPSPPWLTKGLLF